MRTLNLIFRKFPGTVRLFSSHPPEGFTYIPNFLSTTEQAAILDVALTNLNNVDSSAARRKRKKLLETGSVSRDHFGFLVPEDCYDFQPGHFDGVIKHYRETRLNQWPDSLQSVITRIQQLLPSVPIQTHVLHLSTNGEILPHVDNVNASGNFILAVSLGSPRLLRLQNNTTGQTYDQLLEAGSVYIQRAPVRFNFTHSILKTPSWNGVSVPQGQRLSIMIRDLLSQESN